jgi:Ca2+-binding EF-hand superfamily protein
MTTAVRLTELQQRKLTRRFELFDADGNGFIERADCEEIARNLCAEYDPEMRTAAGHKVYSAYLNLWEQVMVPMDINGDGKVSRDEFMASVGQQTKTPEEYGRAFRPIIEAVTELCDRDGDGALNAEEFTGWLRACRVSPNDADMVFSKLDRDDDGTLTVDELVIAFQEYWCSQDPNARGNWLFGPF